LLLTFFDRLLQLSEPPSAVTALPCLDVSGALVGITVLVDPIAALEGRDGSEAGGHDTRMHLPTAFAAQQIANVTLLHEVSAHRRHRSCRIAAIRRLAAPQRCCALMRQAVPLCCPRLLGARRWMAVLV